MQRRAFVASVLASGLAVPALAHENHRHRPLDGPLASATVSFGAWPSDPPFDRMPPVLPPPGPLPNIHRLTPSVATVKVGGTINFVIAGFHQVVVYGPDTQPSDIDTSLTIPVPGAPPGFPPLIDDPTNRVYRGVNPFNLLQDRVEVVHFNQRGRYLVICGFLPHFEDDMFGWVRVVGR